METQSEPARALERGQIFHQRYRIERLLSQGGMGAVYEAVHLETKRRRALKVMLPDLGKNEGLRERFKLETTVAAEIRSEHIVEIFDAGVDEATGAPFLVMELLEGRDLASLLEAGPLAAADVVRLLWQVALGLDKTHAAGIVHRDLKPENLFVTERDDGSPCVKILDFGIAKVVAESAGRAKTTQTVGTPLYMAPEQITGDGAIGTRADLYALGHIAYTLLVGAAYFDAEASGPIYQLMMKVVGGSVDPASARAAARGVALCPAFDGWFARATALDPALRFASATELCDELAAALGVPLPASHRAPGSGMGPAWQGRGSGSGASSPKTTPLPSQHRSGDTEVSGDHPLAPAATPAASTTAAVSSRKSSYKASVRLPVIRSRAGLAVLGIAALAVVGAGAFFALRPRETASSATATATSSPVPAPAPVPAPVPDSSSAPTPTPTATATATATTTATATPTATARASNIAKGPAIVATAKPKANCDPGYTIGADGKKHWRPECI